MKLYCPKCSASKKYIRKSGHYFRKSDSRKIQRFRCSQCHSHFSRATFCPNYRQNKRQLNNLMKKLFCSKVSQRRMAIILKCNRKTVARKLKILSLQARMKQETWKQDKVFEHILFDDLETVEHSKLKPVTVTLAVNSQRKILGFGVAQIPAKGHLIKASVKKYGKRKNEAIEMRDRLFCDLTPLVSTKALIDSDEHPHYRELIRKHFPKAEHRTFKGERSSLYGQGELKRKSYDPLFKINHTLAMLRDNLSRLVRKTWATTKSIEALEDHIAIYVDFHNSVLTESAVRNSLIVHPS